LGGLLDAPHGECNALLLPYIIDFNFDAVPDRYMLIGEAMGLSTMGMAPDDMRSALHSKITFFRESAGITHTLARLGVTKSDIPELAQKALNDPCIFTNPRQPTIKDIEAIYEKAL